MNDSATQARQHFLDLLFSMLDGRLSYFEGAAQVLNIDRRLLGIPERDTDFEKFVLIRSETDHLPLRQQQSLWSADALEKLRGEFAQTEEWAKTFAPEACNNLIARLKKG
ncbi:hypothetical protein [Paraburkholderia acidipaludis]|uniref:hypothetical protein n=1 Tax=Paraburkholderia acidipaludis TaxID=660537 RepID=UPI0009FE059B|nr:hypothetical protein [Paraburkholderia acidipaludis]